MLITKHRDIPEANLVFDFPVTGDFFLVGFHQHVCWREGRIRCIPHEWSL